MASEIHDLLMGRWMGHSRARGDCSRRVKSGQRGHDAPRPNAVAYGAGDGQSEGVEKAARSGDEKDLGAAWVRTANDWLRDIRRDGPAPQIGAVWNDRLDEWLTEALSGTASERNIQDWSFPSEQLLEEYVQTIHDRSEAEVLGLLRLFLFPPSSFSLEDQLALTELTHRDLNVASEFDSRLLGWLGAKDLPHPGVRWALDLLPTSPRRALAAIEAYMVMDWMNLPDGRINGLSDALALIRARYLGVPASLEERRLSLYELSPRDFERLVDKLFDRMGYETELTMPSRDGGRDVIAIRSDPGRRDSVRVECKLRTHNVGVRVCRELLGVVSAERATRGVIAAAGGFTRGARAFAEENPRVELLSGDRVVALANEFLGADWPTRLDTLLSPVVSPEVRTREANVKSTRIETMRTEGSR